MSHIRDVCNKYCPVLLNHLKLSPRPRIASVDVAVGAIFVPEPAAVPHCTVVCVVSIGPQVVVAVVRGKHHSIVVSECIVANVT